MNRKMKGFQEDKDHRSLRNHKVFRSDGGNRGQFEGRKSLESQWAQIEIKRGSPQVMVRVAEGEKLNSFRQIIPCLESTKVQSRQDADKSQTIHGQTAHNREWEEKVAQRIQTTSWKRVHQFQEKGREVIARSSRNQARERSVRNPQGEIWEKDSQGRQDFGRNEKRGGAQDRPQRVGFKTSRI